MGTTASTSLLAAARERQTELRQSRAAALAAANRRLAAAQAAFDAAKAEVDAVDTSALSDEQQAALHLFDTQYAEFKSEFARAGDARVGALRAAAALPQHGAELEAELEGRPQLPLFVKPSSALMLQGMRGADGRMIRVGLEARAAMQQLEQRVCAAMEESEE